MVESNFSYLIMNIINNNKIRSYNCIGDANVFSKEIELFISSDWKLNSNTDSVSTTIFINANDEDLDFDCYINDRTEFIFIYIPIDKIKKKLYPFFETKGFFLYKERGSISFFYKVRNKKNIVEKITIEKLKSINVDVFKKINGKYDNEAINIVKVPYDSLLTYRRMDIAIKYIYAYLYKKRKSKEWRDLCYYEQARKITGPNKEIIEYNSGVRTKVGLDSFVSQFNDLIDNIDKIDPPLFPIDRECCLIDGSHRATAKIFLEQEIEAIEVDIVSNCDASYNFFKQKQKNQPAVDAIVLDEAVINYVKLKKNIVVALVFPSVKNKNKAKDYIKSKAKVVCEKDIFLTKNAAGVLLRQVYLGHSWIEFNKNSNSLQSKIDACFPADGKLTAIVIEGLEPENIRITKNNIREMYNNGNNSIHFTDGYDEALRLTKILFNKNSLEILDNIKLDKVPKDFHNKIFKFRDYIESNGLDEYDFCIDSSAILTLLGIRNCRDIDFLYSGNINQLPPRPNKVECHNEMTEFYTRKHEDIIYDPRLHFYYMGLKFCHPKLVYLMKLNRSESKDKVDTIYMDKYYFRKKLISGFMKLIYIRSFSLLKINIYHAKVFAKRIVRTIIKNVR